MEKYVIDTSKGPVQISFDEGVFRIEGPKEIMTKAVGGLGGENETIAWITEKELKTEEMRLFVLIEIMKHSVASRWTTMPPLIKRID